MEHVDKIARGEPPARPDVMLKVYLLADEEMREVANGHRGSGAAISRHASLATTTL